MTRVWFSTELETVATTWRIARRDGVTLGFVTHDRDLWLGGVLYRAAPGLTPSAIRRTGGLEADSAEVEGVLAHDALAAADIAAGRFDGAAIAIGRVDWQSGEATVLYQGTIGEITEEGERFRAAVSSRKAVLARDTVPRTSPACRAGFCGPGCTLSSARYTARAHIAGCDLAANTVTLGDDRPGAAYAGGRLRWLGGPLAGTGSAILSTAGAQLVLVEPLGLAVPAGTAVLLREGCDRTIATCATRFANAANFQGEPYLPGTDFLTRSPAAT